MNIRSSRKYTSSAKSKHSVSTYIPSFADPDQIPLRSKTKQSISQRAGHRRLYSQNMATIQSSCSLNIIPFRNRYKSLLFNSKSSTLQKSQKIEVPDYTQRINIKACKIPIKKRKIHLNKNNQISVSKLKTNNSYTIGYQQFLKQDSSKKSTLMQITTPKLKWKYYEGQDLTPRITEFRIVLEGDPLVKIFGNNQHEDIEKKYNKFNEKLLKDIPIYKLRSRTPKSLSKWRC